MLITKTNCSKMAKKSKKGANVPNLRFPGFREDWKSAKLGEIVDFKVTNSLSRERLNYKSGTVKNIHYGDIHTKFQTLFDIDKEQVPFINEDVPLSKVQEDYYCKDGDLVFADASEDLNDIGKSIEVLNVGGHKVLAGLHTLHGRPKSGVFFPGFAGYLLLSNSVRNQIQREAQGAKVLGISVNRISKINLIYPSIEEQEKIAVLLSKIDDRIQTQNKVLTDRAFNQKLRFKKADNHKFPDWKVAQLREVFSFKTTNSFSRENLNYSSGRVKNIHYGDVHTRFASHFFMQNEPVPYVNIEIDLSKIADDSYCREGDIVIADASEDIKDIGKSLEIVDLNGENVLAGLHTILARPFPKVFSPGFAGYLLKCREVKLQIRREAQGSKVSSISPVRLGSVVLKIPSLKEQEVIAEFLMAIDEKIILEKNLLTKYELQKRYLLSSLVI